MNTVTGRAVLGSCGRNGMVVLETRVIDHLHLGKSERAKATGIFKVCVHAHV